MMKRIIFSIMVLMLCVSGTALAEPVMLPSDQPVWLDFQNREQISPTGTMKAPSGNFESNWGIAVVNAIRLGTITEANANIEGDFTVSPIFLAGYGPQITAMFYGITLVNYNGATHELRSGNGFIDLYWDEPGLAGGGTIVNLPTLLPVGRTADDQFASVTDGIFLARLEFASGIDRVNGAVTVIGKSAGFPASIAGTSSAESYANQITGAVNWQGTLGYWDRVLDKDWFTTEPLVTGGLPLAFGSRDVRFRNTFSALLAWSAIDAQGNPILGADSTDPATTFTTKPCIDIDKYCEIVQPPEPEWAVCRGKIQQFTLIWPKDEIITISGIANNAPGGVVNPGQKVTFTGPFSSNDLYLNISGAVSEQSTFHVSCSDKDMDGLTATNLEQQQLPGKMQDCGKFEGNGKAKSGTWVNIWLLEGLIDAEGKVLNCSPEPTPPTDSCSFEAQEPPACGPGISYKPSTLTFMYTGGGCKTQSNTQADGKTSCSGQIDPTESVNVTYPGGTATVELGGTFTMLRTQSQSVIKLTNAGGTETDSIHTSCSQPLAVGDMYFSLTLVAEDSVGVGKEVKYLYDVKNTGDVTLYDITVEDDMLGTLQDSPIASLAPGATTTLTATALIDKTTTNVAMASIDTCIATATATVNVLPPPPCTVKQTFYTVEDDKYKVKLTNTGNKVVTLDTLILEWPDDATYTLIKEVKLDGSIYKKDMSNLVVGSDVLIGPGDWTNPDVTKRQLDPGETRTLEIVFSTKWPKANCSIGSCFSGTASFNVNEGCEVDLSQ